MLGRIIIAMEKGIAMRNRKNYNNQDYVPPWMSPDPMSDPMTGGYGSGPVTISSILVIIIVGILPVLFFIVAFIAGIVQETIDANTLNKTDVTTATTVLTNEPKGSTVQTHAASDIEYKTVEIFGNLSIDIPATADEVASEEGVCFEVSDGSLRALIVEIPDPDGTYPENVIEYCEQRGIEMKCIVDPEGAVSFYAESIETDNDGNEVYVEEDFQSYGRNDYRVRVESKNDDYTISSHILGSLRQN